MKKAFSWFSKAILLLICSLLFFSCATVSLQLPQPQEDYEVSVKDISKDSSPDMEFLGFEATTTMLCVKTPQEVPEGDGVSKVASTDMSDFESWQQLKRQKPLKDLGRSLQKGNIAQDKSLTYTGDFSLEQLKEYATSCRYLTFVKINKNNLQWYGECHTGSNAQRVWGIVFCAVGGGLIGIGAGTSNIALIIPGGILAGVGFITTCAWSARVKIFTDFDYSGSYEIVIYDTQQKQFVAQKKIEVATDTLECQGLYSNDSDKITAYYAPIIANAILKEYDKLD